MFQNVSGQHSTMASVLCVPKKISEEKIVDVAEVNQRRWLEESGQWLENVDQTHIVLASGKLVLQKYYFKMT